MTTTVTVPVEPTVRMLSAGAAHMRDDALYTPNSVWSAMLSAVPAPEGGAVDASAILEMAAKAIEDHQKEGREWIKGSLWDDLTREAAGRIRALKSARAAREETPAGSAHPCYEEHQPGCDCAIPAQKASPVPSFLERMTSPAEAGEDDDDASTYRPSVAGLSDYLWNQALSAESVASRCILEMWREAVDSSAQTGQRAKTLDRLYHVEDWAQAPSALRAQPPAREDAQPVARLTDLADDAEAMSLEIAIENYAGTGASITSDLRAVLATHPAPDGSRWIIPFARKVRRGSPSQTPPSPSCKPNRKAVRDGR